MNFYQVFKIFQELLKAFKIISGPLFKYSSIQVPTGGTKSMARNTTAASLLQCAGQCNAAFLDAAK
jgi:hypothetical protein